MWRDQPDIEGEALEAIKAAKGDPSRPHSILKLAAGHPLVESVEEIPLLSAPARTKPGRDDPERARIEIRGGQSAVARQWWGSHEFGEVIFRREGLDETDGIERMADRFAAAVVAPRPAFVRVWEDLEDRVADLDELVTRVGRRFHASAKTVLLRMSEVRDVPVAIITEGNLWPLRGMTPGLPPDGMLRALVSGYERGEPPPRWCRILRMRKSPKGPLMWVITGDY